MNMELSSSQLSLSQLRYLREVLGVEQILWRKSSEASLHGTRITVFVEQMNTLERELLIKMLNAMKLDSKDYEIIEEPTNDEYKNAISRKPILSLVFSHKLAERLQIPFTRGKFANQDGVATIVTYGPTDLTKNPELKSEAWKDMKQAMTRLDPA
jgi:hypothetical protein